MTGHEFPTATVSTRALNIAKASISNLRAEAALVRAQAATIAAAKRRSPRLFHEADIVADLAEAERIAARHDRRADEIEAATMTGLLSRPAEETKWEAVERRQRAAEAMLPGLVSPDPAAGGAAVTSEESPGLHPVAAPAPVAPEPRKPTFETRPVATPAGFRSVTEEK